MKNGHLTIPVDIQTIQEVLNCVCYPFRAVDSVEFEDGCRHLWHNIKMSSANHVNRMGEKVEIFDATLLLFVDE